MRRGSQAGGMRPGKQVARVDDRLRTITQGMGRSLETLSAAPRYATTQLSIPILIVTGENTIKIHKLVNEELARLLPKAAQAIIPKAGHGSARENSQAFNEAVLHFLFHHRL